MRFQPVILPLVLALLLFAACKPRVVAPTVQAEASTCLMACDAQAFSQCAQQCAAFKSRLKQLSGIQFDAIWEALVQDDPVGTNMDGLWYTLFAEVEKEGIRIQATIVAEAKTDRLFVGYWDSQTDQLRQFAEGEGKTPPPFQAWLDDSN